jgi:hypothetical protein
MRRPGLVPLEFSPKPYSEFIRTAKLFKPQSHGVNNKLVPAKAGIESLLYSVLFLTARENMVRHLNPRICKKFTENAVNIPYY